MAANDPRPLRVFIGCPGDMAPERDALMNLANFPRSFHAPVQFKTWTTTAPGVGDPQEVIFKEDPIENFDIVVILLWKRLGVPSGYKDSLTGKEMTGTEAEFILAYEAHQRSGGTRPQILLYRCTRPTSFDVHDKNIAERAAQLQSVQRFFDERNTGQPRAFLPQKFGTTEELNSRFPSDLNAAIERLHAADGDTTTPHKPITPNLPWHLPRRDFFRGRDEAVAQVATALGNHRVVVLHGPGGAGKTALAAHAIAKVATSPSQPGIYPSGIFQHDYYRAPGHIAALTSLLEQAGLKTADVRDPDAAVEQLFETPDRLIYLEGCERAEDLGALLRLLGDTRVLITTRKASDRQRGHPIEVHPLPVSEAARVIRHHERGSKPQSAPPDWTPWEKLAAHLGGHALACERAGRILEADGLTPAELLAAIQTQGITALGGDNHEHESVSEMLRRDVEALSSTNQGALAVWHMLALGALAPIPVAPVAAGAEMPEDDVRALFGKLEARGLVRWEKIPGEDFETEEKGWLLTHALLAEFGRRELTTLAVPLSNGTFVPQKAVNRWKRWWYAFASRSHNARTVPGGHLRYRMLAPHFNALLARVEESSGEGADELAIAQGQMASLHVIYGEIAAATVLYEQQLEHREERLGPDHPDTLTSINELAILLETKGDLTRAEPLFRRALAGYEKVFGPDHPYTLTGVNNLACLLSIKGDLDGAEPLLRHALATREKALGSDHPSTLSSVNNLAYLLKAKGNLAGAEALYIRALATFEKVFGPEHPDTLRSVNNLAALLNAKGDSTHAEPLYRRALAGREKVLGPEHPATCISAFNLARFLEQNGRKAEIGALVQRAYEGWKATLGEQHERTRSAAILLQRLKKEP